jgi:chemotaxis protein MotB
MALRKKRPIAERKRDASTIMFLALNMILLAFFILLVALSAPNVTKEAELRIEVKKAFQSFGGSFLGLGAFVTERGISREENPITDTEKVEALLGELTQFVEENEEVKAISYEITSEGLSIHVSDDLAFAPGATEISEKGLPIYNRIYTLIARTTNKVRVEGHTDNVPIRAPAIRDNWELSAKRALAVFRFFTASGEIPQNRFQVMGRGMSRPQASNLTGEGRAQNRRVSVVFLGSLTRVGESAR